MIKKFTTSTLFLLIIMSLGLSSVHAQQDEWKDKKFDFSKVKTIMYLNPVALQTVQDSLAVQKVTDVMEENFLKNQQKVRLVSLIDVLKLIQADTGVNIPEFYNSNPQQCMQFISSNIPKHCDLVLKTEILAMGYSTKYMEGYSYPVTTYQTSTFNASGNRGGFVSGTVTSPTTQYHTVPGGDVQVVNMGMRETLWVPSTSKLVWSFSDVRDRANSRKFDNTKTEDILGRIMNSISDKFSDLLERK